METEGSGNGPMKDWGRYGVHPLKDHTQVIVFDPMKKRHDHAFIRPGMTIKDDPIYGCLYYLKFYDGYKADFIPYQVIISLY